MHHKRVDKAGPGDNVGMNIKVRGCRGRAVGWPGGAGLQGWGAPLEAGSALAAAAAAARAPQPSPQPRSTQPKHNVNPNPNPSSPPHPPPAHQGLDKGNMPRTGDVMILKSDATLKPVKDFTAQIQTLDIPGEVKAGYSPIGFVRCGRSACRITGINWKVRLGAGWLLGWAVLAAAG